MKGSDCEKVSIEYKGFRVSLRGSLNGFYYEILRFKSKHKDHYYQCGLIPYEYGKSENDSIKWVKNEVRRVAAKDNEEETKMKREIVEGKVNLSFDDVSIKTGLSTVESRSDVDITTDLGSGYKLDFPVMTAAMDTITSPDMAEAILNIGGAIVHHRNQSVSERADLLDSFKGQDKVIDRRALNGVAVGASISADNVEELILSGANLIALEVAHAYNKNIVGALRRIGKKCRKHSVLFMVGNFSGVDGVRWLENVAGELVDLVKVSQGGGSCCTTRLEAGIGKPTLQSVIDLARSNQYSSFKVIADGGIRVPGDLGKSIAAGASAGMLGGMLAGTYETPGDVKVIDGVGCKEFRGMASKGSKGVQRNVEGISTHVSCDRHAEEVFDRISDGLRSGIASAGFDSLQDFKRSARLIRMSPAARSESEPHARDI